MTRFKLRKCKTSGHEWKQYNSLQKCTCDSCKSKAKKPKKIKPVSEKRKAENLVYSELRRVFLNRPENKVCPITGQPTTDVHHRKGRIGKLLLDTKYWLAVSREGHQKIEENPEWAYAMGYSLKRLQL